MVEPNSAIPRFLITRFVILITGTVFKFSFGLTRNQPSSEFSPAVTVMKVSPTAMIISFN